MDIVFDKENRVFNYRIAAIIEKDGKFLVTEHPDEKYLCLMGGRAKIGESSIETIKREVGEEIGYQVSEAKVIGIVENFFTSIYNKKEYHEMLILIKVDFEDNGIYTKDKIKCLDKDITFVWKDTEELKKEHFEPACIIDYLKETNLFHIINK